MRRAFLPGLTALLAYALLFVLIPQTGPEASGLLRVLTLADAMTVLIAGAVTLARLTQPHLPTKGRAE